jgi:undecaprenyl-diphosphatase
MVSGRTAPVTAVAKVFNWLGLVYVTLPVRIAIAGFLALRRRWWHLAAFAAAVVLSEVLIGPLKGSYDRARPPGSLVATSGASFTSGHSVAATDRGRRGHRLAARPRGWRGVRHGGLSVLMALSRAYPGTLAVRCPRRVLLGASCAAGRLRGGRAQGRRTRIEPPVRPIRPSRHRPAY